MKWNGKIISHLGMIVDMFALDISDFHSSICVHKATLFRPGQPASTLALL